MKIYIAHASNTNFQTELYNPIKASELTHNHTFIFPHDNTDQLFNSKDLFQNGCDLIIAEVSNPSTGLGIELGWANILKIPVICLYKTGTKPSTSLKTISDTILEYSDAKDLITKISNHIK
jgi:nucleoside 2-deoxyribosyltransferase